MVLFHTFIFVAALYFTSMYIIKLIQNTIPGGKKINYVHFYIWALTAWGVLYYITHR